MRPFGNRALFGVVLAFLWGCAEVVYEPSELAPPVWPPSAGQESASLGANVPPSDRVSPVWGLRIGAPPRAFRRPTLEAMDTLLDRGRITAGSCAVQGEPTAALFTATKLPDALPDSSDARYSIYSTRGIVLGALVGNVCGEQIAAFELFAPDGSLYKRALLPFTAEGDGVGVRRVEGGTLVWVGLPVAGTEIAERPLVGTWSVNFALGEDGPALGLGIFEITR